MEPYLSLLAITKKRAVSAPPTTSYEINPVQLDTILNIVLFNIKVSKVKLSNHRKLIIFAILFASGDVESNPGPVTEPCMVHHASESVCPCGHCELAVGWTPAVACDQCEVWYQKSCLGMTSQSYERLNSTISWYCPKCESINVSTIFIHEWIFATRNSFAVLDTSVQSIDIVFTPTIHSTPCQTRVKRVVRAPRRQSTRATYYPAALAGPLPLLLPRPQCPRSHSKGTIFEH